MRRSRKAREKAGKDRDNRFENVPKVAKIRAELF
jgi:hypothetical protein